MHVKQRKCKNIPTVAKKPSDRNFYFLRIFFADELGRSLLDILEIAMRTVRHESKLMKRFSLSYQVL